MRQHSVLDKDQGTSRDPQQSTALGKLVDDALDPSCGQNLSSKSKHFLNFFVLFFFFFSFFVCLSQYSFVL